MVRRLKLELSMFLIRSVNVLLFYVELKIYFSGCLVQQIGDQDDEDSNRNETEHNNGGLFPAKK